MHITWKFSAIDQFSEHNLRAVESEQTLMNINIQTSRCDNYQLLLCRRMAENGFAPSPPREFCRHILSGRELKAESF